MWGIHTVKEVQIIRPKAGEHWGNHCAMILHFSEQSECDDCISRINGDFAGLHQKVDFWLWSQILLLVALWFFLPVVVATNEANTWMAFAVLSFQRLWWQRWPGPGLQQDLGHLNLCLHHQRHLLWLDYLLLNMFSMDNFAVSFLVLFQFLFFCTCTWALGCLVVTCGDYIVFLVVTCGYLWHLAGCSYAATSCCTRTCWEWTSSILPFTYVVWVERKRCDVLSDLIHGLLTALVKSFKMSNISVYIHNFTLQYVMVCPGRDEQSFVGCSLAVHVLFTSNHWSKAVIWFSKSAFWWF